MMIFSIVRITEPGANCSHPVGRFEVTHLGAWQGMVSRGVSNPRLEFHVHTHEMARRDAFDLAASFNRNRYADNLGFHYAVEEIDEESPDRAPESPRRVDAVCVPNVVFC